jgi:hypothetical protein
MTKHDRKSACTATSLAIAQAKILKRYGTAGQVQQTLGPGNQGHTESYLNVTVQLCNYGSPFTCDPSDLAHLFDSIQCGTADAPTEGLSYYSQLH